MPADLIQAQPQELAPVSLEVLVAQIAQSDSMTTEKVEVIERLVALMERREAQQRKERFEAALLRVQLAVPRIDQNGLMDRGPGKGQIPYAKREDIDLMVRPLYQAEGFTVTWDAHLTPDGSKIDVTGRFTCCGHTEERHWPCSPDSSGGKTGPQAVSSTIAYGKRQISKMVWDIIEEGMDKNGADVSEQQPITAEQALDINTELQDIKADFPRFYRLFGVSKLEELRAGQLTEVYARIKSVKDARVAEQAKGKRA